MAVLNELEQVQGTSHGVSVTASSSQITGVVGETGAAIVERHVFLASTGLVPLDNFVEVVIEKTTIIRIADDASPETDSTSETSSGKWVCIGLPITQMCLGVSILICGAVSTGYSTIYGQVGYGIWSGLFIMLAALFGIVVSHRQGEIKVQSYLVANSFSLILTFTAFLMATIELTHYTDKSNKVSCRGVGLVQIALGLLIIILNFFQIQVQTSLFYMGHGMWIGIMIIITGLTDWFRLQRDSLELVKWNKRLNYILHFLHGVGVVLTIIEMAFRKYPKSSQGSALGICFPMLAAYVASASISILLAVRRRYSW